MNKVRRYAVTGNDMVMAADYDAACAEIELFRRDAIRYQWLLTDADRCASVVADAYADWDTDFPWALTLDGAIGSVLTQEEKS